MSGILGKLAYKTRPFMSRYMSTYHTGDVQCPSVHVSMIYSGTDCSHHGLPHSTSLTQGGPAAHLQPCPVPRECKDSNARAKAVLTATGLSAPGRTQVWKQCHASSFFSFVCVVISLNALKKAIPSVSKVQTGRLTCEG